MGYTVAEYNALLKNMKSPPTPRKMTIEEYREYLASQKTRKPVKNKYRNKKVWVDGILFASEKEANYYNELKIKLRIGRIKGFELQPSFELQEEYIKDRKKVRKITYIADFKVFHNDGSMEIVDTKGYKTKEFRIKRKLFEYQYPELKLSVI